MESKSYQAKNDTRGNLRKNDKELFCFIYFQERAPQGLQCPRKHNERSPKSNLLIGDISAHPLPGLPMDATASLFGNAKGNATREDIALGIICMVLQAIGSSTILSSLGSGIRDYVLIGNLTLLPQCQEVFSAMEQLYDVHFSVPKYSEFCTAIGTALSYILKVKK